MFLYFVLRYSIVQKPCQTLIARKKSHKKYFIFRGYSLLDFTPELKLVVVGFYTLRKTLSIKFYLLGHFINNFLHLILCHSFS